MSLGENANLVQEFEESFQKSIAALTEDDDLMGKDQETINNTIEDKVTRFSDLARQLETFFLQKRFLIYNYKPEMVLKVILL
ncbi:mediator of RNA polymerase II transcription subunit 28-like [Eurytemora carolleeae]|uniref:mediator of RNA polymerase II transcription subunit 28-like n=1 Tax=Eurytemora carolleeae TaxID=1294199 RepID=UPI000C7816F9|nr:mediator of RNA polymerase II transcription subunit 28-like [Eurytemora carolleeae]|eukprot:XP_023341034.1 mediator of RNA polymerase II transcription subunit 28-like [Eurytemora affinis]